MISLNLFREAAVCGNPDVQLAGFDIEKPDLISLVELESETTEEIYAPQPVIEVTKCRFCGICSGNCIQKAIQFNRFVPSVTLIVSRCFACGNCQKACNRDGMQMKEKHVGKIIQSSLGQHQIIAGELDLESEFKIPLIKALLKRLNPEAICICDFEPGSDMAVKVALEEMDVAVIVLQNMPDWKQNLDDMLVLTNKNQTITGLIINKAEGGSAFSENVKAYCDTSSVHFLGIVPYLARLENSMDFNENHGSEIPNQPISEIWNAITKLHPDFQSIYNETFTQH